MANSADPDQTAPDEQSDQGLPCLQKHDLFHVLQVVTGIAFTVSLMVKTMLSSFA